MAKVVTNVTSRSMWKYVLPVRWWGPNDHTASFTITAKMSGGTFTNRGASGGIVFTLPSAPKGTRFTFAVVTADELDVAPPTGGRLEYNGAGTWASHAADKVARGDTLADCITFVSKGSNDYMAVNQTGTWTDTSP